MAHTSNPSIGREEIGRSLGLAGQPAYLLGLLSWASERPHLINNQVGAGEMAQQVRTLLTLPEHLGSITTLTWWLSE